MRRLRRGPRRPGPGRDPLHRLDRDLPAPVAARSARTSTSYRSYPRIVGETGGKDFVVAHPSRRPRRRCGPRWCAARSSTRARSARRPRAPTCRAVAVARMRDDLAAEIDGADDGSDVTDFSNFIGAVIDDRAFAELTAAIDRAPRTRRASTWSPAARTTTPRAGSSDPPSSRAPTPPTRSSRTEYFGPILAVHVYDDDHYDARAAPDGVGLAVRADRLDHRPGPGRDRRRPTERAAVRGRQLLHQRQADRCGRRPAAVRRRPRVRHERQGGRACRT